MVTVDSWPRSPEVKKDEVELDLKNLYKYITPQDLKAFGLIPELIGRVPVLTHLNPLDIQALRNIRGRIEALFRTRPPARTCALTATQ